MNPLFLIAAGAVLGLIFSDRKDSQHEQVRENGDHSGTSGSGHQPSTGPEQDHRDRVTEPLPETLTDKDKTDEIPTNRTRVPTDGGGRNGDNLHPEPVAAVEVPSVGTGDDDQQLTDKDTNDA